MCYLSQAYHGTILIFIFFLSIIIMVIIQQVFLSHMAGSMSSHVFWVVLGFKVVSSACSCIHCSLSFLSAVH